MKSFLLIGSVCSLALVSIAAPQADDPLAKEWRQAGGIATEGPRVEIHKTNEIAVDVPGTLIKLDPGTRGGFVEKGQTVVEIDSSIAQAELEQLDHKAASTILIDFAKLSLRQEELRLKDMEDKNKRAGSAVFKENELIEQKLAIEKGKAEVAKSLDDQQAEVLAAATKRVELTKYKKVAQISGIVTDLHKKSEGTSVRQGDPIMTIVDFEKMTVKMNVHPRYETQVKIGDRVVVRRVIGDEAPTPGNTGDSFLLPSGGEAIKTRVKNNDVAEYFFEGVVIFTSSQANSDEANTFQVEAVVNNKSLGRGNYLLKEGVRVEAKIFPR